MENKQGDGRKPMWLGALVLCLAASAAWAGPAEDNAEAEKEFAKGNLIGALKLWKGAAEKGYAPAQVWLGEILDTSEEDEDAVIWYRKAAEQNDPAGMFGLGQMYLKGEGVKLDLEQARGYIQRAAEKDFVKAVAWMRDLYRYGWYGTPVDKEKSQVWATKLKEITGTDEEATKPKEEAPTGRRRRR